MSPFDKLFQAQVDKLLSANDKRRAFFFRGFLPKQIEFLIKHKTSLYMNEDFIEDDCLQIQKIEANKRALVKQLTLAENSVVGFYEELVAISSAVKDVSLVFDGEIVIIDNPLFESNVPSPLSLEQAVALFEYMQTDVKGCQYCLKLDARKYYPSIDHDILKAKYARLFKDKDLLWLLYEIIDSTEGNTGVPIGNYLSQYSGNFYFSSFDHWLKEEKHVKHYHRYMDDIVIFGETKEELHQLLKEIDVYFKEKLHLTVKDNWQVFPTYVRGVDFLGYRIFMNYILLRKSTCKQMKRKMTDIRKKVSNGNMMNYSEWCSINSYKGWLIHCDSFRLQQKYIQPLIPHAEKYYETNIKTKRKAVCQS